MLVHGGRYVCAFFAKEILAKICFISKMTIFFQEWKLTWIQYWVSPGHKGLFGHECCRSYYWNVGKHSPCGLHFSLSSKIFERILHLTYISFPNNVVSVVDASYMFFEVNIAWKKTKIISAFFCCCCCCEEKDIFPCLAPNAHLITLKNKWGNCIYVPCSCNY